MCWKEKSHGAYLPPVDNGQMLFLDSGHQSHAGDAYATSKPRSSSWHVHVHASSPFSWVACCLWPILAYVGPYVRSWSRCPACMLSHHPTQWSLFLLCAGRETCRRSPTPIVSMSCTRRLPGE
jgi:hypothetical protein